MTTQDVSADPRWQAFNQDGFPCSCGERHVGLFPVNMLTPAMWDGPKEYAPDEEIQLDRTTAETFDQFDSLRGELRTHRRIHVGIATRDAVPCRARQDGDAAHEGAADAKDVNMHIARFGMMK